MHPVLETTADLRPLLAQLCEAEDRYHAASPAATVLHFERIVAPDFWEIGASGRRYSRAFCLQVLAQRPAVPPAEAWRTRDAHLQALGADHCLLSYTLEQPGRTTLRATVWRRIDTQWQAVFHQGTVLLP